MGAGLPTASKGGTMWCRYCTQAKSMGIGMDDSYHYFCALANREIGPEPPSWCPFANRCITCKYWTDPGWDSDWNRNSGQYGECEKMEQLNYEENTIAYATCGYGQMASLYTKADFGCNRWEPANAILPLLEEA